MIHRRPFPKSEAGYASVVIAALMTLVSVIVMGAYQLALANAKKASRLTQQIERDAVLETAASRLLASLVTGNVRLDHEIETKQQFVSGRLINIVISYDSARIPVNALSTDQVEKLLVKRIGPRDWIKSFAQLHRQDQRISRASFAAFLGDLPQGDAACLRDAVNLFSRGVLPPPQTISRGTTVPDGAVLFLRATDNSSGSVRWLDVAGIKTGRRDDPFWVLEWQTGSGTPGCPMGDQK